jgi:hypothetical protein
LGICRSTVSKPIGVDNGWFNAALSSYLRPAAALPDELKARHPDIPWQKVAGIGNVLRHNYENISARIMWKLVKEDLPHLDRACREELARKQTREK